jgi:hypothetical protein
MVLRKLEHAAVKRQVDDRSREPLARSTSSNGDTTNFIPRQTIPVLDIPDQSASAMQPKPYDIRCIVPRRQATVRVALFSCGESELH